MAPPTHPCDRIEKVIRSASPGAKRLAEMDSALSRGLAHQCFRKCAATASKSQGRRERPPPSLSTAQIIKFAGTTDGDKSTNVNFIVHRAGSRPFQKLRDTVDLIVMLALWKG